MSGSNKQENAKMQKFVRDMVTFKKGENKARRRTKKTVVVEKIQHKKPQAKSKRRKNRNNSEKNSYKSGKNTCTVANSEELLELDGSVNFAVSSYSINPGKSFFPWLSLQAQGWQKYRFKYLNFIYTRSVSEYLTQGSGQVAFSFNTDSSDFVPQNMINMLAIKPNVIDLPSKNLTLRIPPALLNRLMDGFFVRGNVLPVGDIKNFDVGKLLIGTTGNGNTQQIGILRADYAVEFFNPVSLGVNPTPINYTTSAFASVSFQALTSGTPVALVTAALITNPLQIVNASGAFTPPPGNYMITSWVSYFGSGSNILYVDTDISIDGAVGKFGSISPAIGSFADSSTSAAVLFKNSVTPISYFFSTDGTHTIAILAAAGFSSGTCGAANYITFQLC
jgi:hypothetical protein